VSALQTPATARSTGTAPTRLARALDALAFEWTKLRSVRSNYITLLIAAAVTLGLTGIVAKGFSAAPANGQQNPIDPLASNFLAFAEYTGIPVTVLSTLVFTSEYGSGLIRSTFTAIPRRCTVLAAKAAVTGGAVLVIGEFLAFACFLLTQAILSGNPRHLSLADHGVLGGVLAAGFALAVFALIAVGIGAIVRHTAGGIAASLAVAFLIGALSLALPAPWNIRIGRFTPPFAAYQTILLHPQSGLLSPTLSLLVLIAWPAVILLAAAVVITRRDV
jgi:ABC-type transport system involved in multi-copper enzyme maturation permease subunit